VGCTRDRKCRRVYELLAKVVRDLQFQHPYTCYAEEIINILCAEMTFQLNVKMRFFDTCILNDKNYDLPLTHTHN